jgi:hypothetical protein
VSLDAGVREVRGESVEGELSTSVRAQFALCLGLNNLLEALEGGGRLVLRCEQDEPHVAAVVVDEQQEVAAFAWRDRAA